MYVSTSDCGSDDTYALTTNSLELIKGVESSQQAATMTKEMESLDKENQAIGCKRFYEKKEGTSSASEVQFQVPNHVCSSKKSLYGSKQASGQ